jgi:hypothetical protein
VVTAVEAAGAADEAGTAAVGEAAAGTGTAAEEEAIGAGTAADEEAGVEGEVGDIIRTTRKTTRRHACLKSHSVSTLVEKNEFVRFCNVVLA